MSLPGHSEIDDLIAIIRRSDPVKVAELREAMGAIPGIPGADVRRPVRYANAVRPCRIGADPKEGP